MSFKWAKVLSAFGLLGGIVHGIAGGAANAPQPLESKQEHLAAWAGVRDQIRGSTTLPELNPDIRDFVQFSDIENGLEKAVRDSFAMANSSEIGALDDHWLGVLVSRSDSKLMSDYLLARSELADVGPYDGKGFLNRWLVEAKGQGGCDGGNPGNDKPVGGSGEDPNDSGGFGDGNTGVSS